MRCQEASFVDKPATPKALRERRREEAISPTAANRDMP